MKKRRYGVYDGCRKQVSAVWEYYVSEDSSIAELTKEKELELL